jgi:hypothetical protein
VQVRGGEERLGTDTSCTAGTASVRMQEDGRHVRRESDRECGGAGMR